jgi:hypothetical protein
MVPDLPFAAAPAIELVYVTGGPYMLQMPY